MAFDLLTQASDNDVEKIEVWHRSRAHFPSKFKSKLFAPFPEGFRNYSQFNPTSYAAVTWILKKTNGSHTFVSN